MRNLSHPPGSDRHNLKSPSISVALAALATIALNVFNFMLGVARDLAQAVVPDQAPKLALAGGAQMSKRAEPQTRGHSPTGLRRTSGKSSDLMTMIKRGLAGRPHRRGPGMARSAGQFGGGGAGG